MHVCFLRMRIRGVLRMRGLLCIQASTDSLYQHASLNMTFLGHNLLLWNCDTTLLVGLHANTTFDYSTCFQCVKKLRKRIALSRKQWNAANKHETCHRKIESFIGLFYLFYLLLHLYQLHFRNEYMYFNNYSYIRLVSFKLLKRKKEDSFNFFNFNNHL